MASKRLSVFQKWVQTLVAVLFVSMLLRTFVADIYLVPTASMQPSLQPGAMVCINKAAFGAHVLGFKMGGFATPKKGDIIAFYMPAEGGSTKKNKTKFIKRCTGAPHDKVVLWQGLFKVLEQNLSGWVIPAKGDSVVISEQNLAFFKPLIEQYEHQKVSMLGNVVYINGKPNTLLCFSKTITLLRATTKESHDSRYWGLLPADHLIGRMVFRQGG